MSTKYTYLFPYEKIPQGTRIIIYGAGDVGQEYLQQMKLTGYCEVVAFIDRAYEKYPPMIIPIYPMEKIKQLTFDYVVLAFKMGVHVRSVTKELISQGVKSGRIVYVEPRQEVTVLAPLAQGRNTKNYDFAYLHEGVSIALKYGPGLGDAIVKKKLFIELVAMAPKCLIDIYSPGVGGIINSIYSDQINLNEVIDDGGAIYAEKHTNYDVALTVSFVIDMDGFNKNRLNKINPEFCGLMEKLQSALKEYNLGGNEVTRRYIHFSRMKFLGLDYYTYPNFTGVLNIRDHHVHIPIDQFYEKKLVNLNMPGRYITVNYGGGVVSSGKNNDIAKEWPYERLVDFVKLFKQNYPGISVVQLGSKNTLRIEGVDECFLGENLELVKYILRDSLLHVDKEGGLVHLATQLGTRCVVCFGPTQEEFFAYPENVNIKAGSCHGCHCLYDGFDVCARGMEKPECMWGITTEMVMDVLEILPEFKLSWYAEKILIEMYLRRLMINTYNEIYDINSNTVRIPVESFKFAVAELAGNNVFHKMFINREGIRETGILDESECVSIGSSTFISELGINYIEEKYNIGEISDKISCVRALSKSFPLSSVVCCNIVVDDRYEEYRWKLYEITQKAEKWIQQQNISEIPSSKLTHVIFSSDFWGTRLKYGLEKDEDKKGPNAEYISIAKESISVIIVNMPYIQSEMAVNTEELIEGKGEVVLTSILVHEILHLYDSENYLSHLLDKVNDNSKDDVVHRFHCFAEARSKFFQELYYITEKCDLIARNYVKKEMERKMGCWGKGKDDLIASEIGQLMCWEKIKDSKNLHECNYEEIRNIKDKLIKMMGNDKLYGKVGEKLTIEEIEKMFVW